MGLVTIDRYSCLSSSSHGHEYSSSFPCLNHTLLGCRFIEYDTQIFLPATRGLKFGIRASASRKAAKRSRRDKQQEESSSVINPSDEKIIAEERNVVVQRSSFGDGDGDDARDESNVYSIDNTAARNSMVVVASRSNVLQACTVTSGLIAALGVIIRQVSHIASTEGLPIPDCSVELSFAFEIWHLELIVGLVIFISSCRYLLLKTWPDFAESSEVANQQVLTSLEPLDYLAVAFLPGLSEEVLFRGALLPLFGVNWRSDFLVAAIFGALHLGSGRKYSFAVWATFVGLVYGFAAIYSSSVVVPMAAHGLNNLVGGVFWRFTSNPIRVDTE